jgi:predicted ATPase
VHITLKFFGPIKSFKFDLAKDFHIIVGENSVGKSYAMTMVYLILKTFLSLETRNIGSALKLDALTELEKIDEAALDLARVTYNQSQLADKAVNAAFRHLVESYFLERLRESIANTFETVDVLQNANSDNEFLIVITSAHCNIKLCLENDKLAVKSVSIGHKYIVKGVVQYRSTRNVAEGRVLYHNTEDNSHIKSALLLEALDLLSQMAQDVYNHSRSIHFLPASRSGLYRALSAFGQIVAEFAKKRTLATKSISLPSIPEPLSDYFVDLASITVDRERFTESTLNRIARDIEKEILHGQVEFESRTKRILFSPDDTNLKLDLAVSSSMVSELSPIVAYLRHILTVPTRPSPRAVKRRASAKALIIIEEPEAHLHPKVQAMLVKHLVELTKLGVKVVLTSHSNYIWVAGKSRQKKRIAPKLGAIR